MSRELRYRRAPHVLWRATLDSVVLLPVTTDVDEPIALAGTGSELWALLAEPCPLDALVEHLAEAHGAEPAVVAADVEPLLERLLALGVVAVV